MDRKKGVSPFIKAAAIPAKQEHMAVWGLPEVQSEDQHAFCFHSSGVRLGAGWGVYHNVDLGGRLATSPPRSHFMVCGVLWTNLTWESRREG